MNILFSDKLDGDFANLGNVASRSLLDTGKAANDQLFWEKVRADFIKQDDNYDIMRFQEDNEFAAGFNVNTGAIVLHDWKKLFGRLSMLNIRQHSPVLLNQELMTAVSTISATGNLMFIT